MTGVLLYLAVMLVMPVLGVWPIRVTRASGRNATNNPLRIEMPPRDTYADAADPARQWRGVYAGELVQWYNRHVVACLTGGLLGLAFGAPWFVTVALMYLATLWTVPFYRLNEYPGKVAYSLTMGLPVDSEAGFLASFNPESSSTSLAALQAGLRRSAPWARVLTGLLQINIRWRG